MIELRLYTIKKQYIIKKSIFILIKLFIIIAVYLIIKAFSSRLFVYIDYYISYFVFPLFIIKIIFLIVKYVADMIVIKRQPLDCLKGANDIQDTICKKNKLVYELSFWTQTVAFILCVVLSISGIQFNSISTKFDDDFAAYNVKEKTVEISNCLFKNKAVEITKTFYNNGYQCKLMCDYSKNCSNIFTESWYKYDSKQFIVSQLSNQYYQTFTYDAAVGEIKQDIDNNMIFIHLRTSNGYAFVQLTYDKLFPVDKQISINQLISYSYSLLSS